MDLLNCSTCSDKANIFDTFTMLNPVGSLSSFTVIYLPYLHLRASEPIFNISYITISMLCINQPKSGSCNEITITGAIQIFIHRGPSVETSEAFGIEAMIELEGQKFILIVFFNNTYKTRGKYDQQGILIFSLGACYDISIFNSYYSDCLEKKHTLA